MSLMESLKEKCKEIESKMIFPESSDLRTLQAVSQLKKENITKPILLGIPDKIISEAMKNNIDIKDIEIINPDNYTDKSRFINDYYELRKHKNITMQTAEKMLDNPLVFAAFLVKEGVADGSVAGAINSTSNVLRSGIQVIGTSENTKTVSSFFIMILPDKKFGENGILFYSDGGVVPYPDENQLADIAINTADNFKRIMNKEARVAMLSFSTNGSANHPSVKKVVTASEIVRKNRKDIIIDGELQADAAIIPSIAERKCPDSIIKGNANVLIFPNLDAGNIAYKLTQRLANAQAIGPIIQGLKRPFNDLSRGCSAKDIFSVAIITVLQGIK